MMCNVTESHAETVILFWTLIATIVSVVISAVISIIERIQNAKINSINILKEVINQPFNKYLLEDFCDIVETCKYRFVYSNQDASKLLFAFDEENLVRMSTRISMYLGEVSYLKYSIPIRYKSVNKKGEKIIYHIENEMLPYALNDIGNTILTQNVKSKLINKNKARRIYKKLLKTTRKFYKSTFRIYKYGL